MAIPCERKHRDQLAYIENPKTVGDVDRRVHDVCANATLEDILVALGGAASGTPFFDEVQTVTTGVLQTLISNVVPGSTTRKLSKVVVSCRREGKFNIKINSTIVGSGRTGASSMNSVFTFLPVRSAVATDTIVVEFTQGSGPATDIEAYLMATDV